MSDSTPEPSDQMGRFAFDGAEGIAFWVEPREDVADGNSRPIAVDFDDLPTLVAFIKHNLPGLVPILNASDAATAKQIADAEVEAYSDFPSSDIRWQDLSQSIHAVARRAFLAGELAGSVTSSHDRAANEQLRMDLADSLSHVDEATDARTLALRVLARLAEDPNWESVEYDDGEERPDPEMVP